MSEDKNGKKNAAYGWMKFGNRIHSAYDRIGASAPF